MDYYDLLRNPLSISLSDLSSSLDSSRLAIRLHRSLQAKNPCRRLSRKSKFGARPLESESVRHDSDGCTRSLEAFRKTMAEIRDPGSYAPRTSVQARKRPILLPNPSMAVNSERSANDLSALRLQDSNRYP